MNYTLHSMVEKISFLFEGTMYVEGVVDMVFRFGIFLYSQFLTTDANIREKFCCCFCAKQIKIKLN